MAPDLKKSVKNWYIQMSEEVTARGVESADAAALVELLNKLQSETETITIDEQIPMLSVQEESDQLELINQSPLDQVIVADFDGSLIGVVSLQCTDSKKAEAELGVGVLKEFWNQGLGSMLVDEAIYWAQTTSKLRKLWLTVIAENAAAIHIYKRAGFEILKAEKMQLPDGEKKNTIMMNLSVKKEF
ncbi:hypothetical protein C5L31_001779 [Secundilactobacillus malefermentans]|uniref:N-acetyltransferase domain-containing protein n=2 Tax=Secundilactobacillus malefermentans TaxID=176292 RepID=A0A4R5NET7_9LACO|nr:hypothetical protein C5L31_001779 [Secundilactobacillus malefermentans]